MSYATKSIAYFVILCHKCIIILICKILLFFNFFSLNNFNNPKKSCQTHQNFKKLFCKSFAEFPQNILRKKTKLAWVLDSVLAKTYYKHNAPTSQLIFLASSLSLGFRCTGSRQYTQFHFCIERLLLAWN